MKKRFLTMGLTLFLMAGCVTALMTGCAAGAPGADSTTGTDATTDTAAPRTEPITEPVTEAPEPVEVPIAQGDVLTAASLMQFQIVYGDGGADYAAANDIRSAILDRYGVDLVMARDTMTETAKYEIVVGEHSDRPACSDLKSELSGDTWGIRFCYGEDGSLQICLTATSEVCLVSGIGRFTEFMLRSDLPFSDSMNGIHSVVPIRDPNVLLDNGTYYIYGTIGVGYYCYTSTDMIDFEGPFLVCDAATIPGADGDFWAPECHAYNGAYYLFATYHSSETGHRGCSIFKASSPLGPFIEITDGHFTPHDVDSIDATLYVDPEGNPWTVYVGEWTTTADKVGTMKAVRLSSDLTHTVGETTTLFNARVGGAKITDGPYLYRTEGGQLIMLWSNGNYGYCVETVRSESGEITGPWEYEDTLYRKSRRSLSTYFDGGHGSLFRDKNGILRMSLHLDNSGFSNAMFPAVEEVDGTLELVVR